MPRLYLFCALLLFALGSKAPSAAEPGERALLVFAAASLTDAMTDVGAAYERDTRVKVKMSFDSSSTLARQIEAGAKADVFFSADVDWMDYLQQRSLIQADTRRNVVGNRLVLVAPADSTLNLKIEPHFKLAAALGNAHLATGDPDSVPVGRYARAALTSLGVWDEVAPHLARAENVRVALLYVARGDAPLGIVYASDAVVEKRVRVVDTFPAETHQAIVYPMALTKTAQAEARSFLSYVMNQGQSTFARYGFIAPPTRPKH
jgi:molybdate transport system substrate-binding protein